MNQLQLYLSREHSCAYLPDRTARTLVIDPHAELDTQRYGYLADRGYRRSGSMIYRPRCGHCRLCIPVRIAVDRFQPRRIQRRITRKWAGVTTAIGAARYEPEHFELYSRYMGARHPDGEMRDMSPDQYMEFLTCSWCRTRFVEFRRDGTLISVAVIDVLPQGLSSVYTFFDPDQAAASPGVYAILWQIAESRRLGLEWVYLGFMVPGCRKMEYKQQYQPLQVYDYALDSWRWSGKRHRA